MPIYAGLGIPEVWRHDDDRIAILQPRNDEGYAEAPESGFLPGITGEKPTRLVSSGLTLDRRTWRKLVRESVSGAGDHPV